VKRLVNVFTILNVLKNQVSTTGLAGGLISPIRAVLLASLKGLFIDLISKGIGAAPC